MFIIFVYLLCDLMMNLVFGSFHSCFRYLKMQKVKMMFISTAFYVQPENKKKYFCTVHSVMFFDSRSWRSCRLVRRFESTSQ